MRWATAALVLFLVGLAAQLAGGPTWTRSVLFTACYAAGGWEPGLAGLKALRHRALDVDLLMVVAALGAAAVGQVLDGALLIVIFATSGALEALATARTEDSVRGLLDLAPHTATRVRSDREDTVRVADLEVGNVILVRPGERIGADGTVIAGGSEVDQATITGEPLPVERIVGDEVFAGTLNGTGALQVRVDRPAGESVVARITELVTRATETKARTQLFIEKVEQRYSIGMVAATIVLFLVPLMIGESVQDSLLRAMTFMIVASPCAVVLATMPPLLAAIATAGRHGVLIKSAVVMELLGATTRFAFDKTGTLTQGRPRLDHVLPLEGHDQDELLVLAAAAELHSEHPLAAAIVKAARERNLPLPPSTDFAAAPGRGVSATVTGLRVMVESPRRHIDIDVAERVASVESEGQTAVVVTINDQPAGVLSITDRIRPDAAEAVAAAGALSTAPPMLLTGDNARTAELVAAHVGIADVRAGLLPDDKVAAIHDLQQRSERVTVVGDGINDAPALAAAHSGIAMSSAGSDLTMHTADAVIISNELRTIPAAIALSRRARRVVIANLVLAATFITGLVIWDLAGYLPLPLGVAGHEGSTVIVGLNGLRLLRPGAWRWAMQGRGDRD